MWWHPEIPSDPSDLPPVHHTDQVVGSKSKNPKNSKNNFLTNQPPLSPSGSPLVVSSPSRSSSSNKVKKPKKIIKNNFLTNQPPLPSGSLLVIKVVSSPSSSSSSNKVKKPKKNYKNNFLTNQ